MCNHKILSSPLPSGLSKFCTVPACSLLLSLPESLGNICSRSSFRGHFRLILIDSAYYFHHYIQFVLFHVVLPHPLLRFWLYIFTHFIFSFSLRLYIITHLTYPGIYIFYVLSLLFFLCDSCTFSLTLVLHSLFPLTYLKINVVLFHPALYGCFSVVVHSYPLFSLARVSFYRIIAYYSSYFSGCTFSPTLSPQLHILTLQTVFLFYVLSIFTYVGSIFPFKLSFFTVFDCQKLPPPVAHSYPPYII